MVKLQSSVLYAVFYLQIYFKKFCHHNDKEVLQLGKLRDSQGLYITSLSKINAVATAETGSLNLWRGAFISPLGAAEAKNLTSVNKINMLIMQVVRWVSGFL